MALSEDLRIRVVEAVVVGGLSRNAAARRFGVGIASAIRWVRRFQATGEISPLRRAGIAAQSALRRMANICLVSLVVSRTSHCWKSRSG